MHLATEVVTGSTVSDAWLRTVTSVNEAPGQRCYHAVTRIAHPASHVLQIRTAADWLSERRGYPAIDTVANTIFPEALAATCTDHEELTERYRRIYGIVRKLDKANRRGTYFGRLVSYPTMQGPHDQIGDLLRKLRAEQASGAPKSARYEVNTSLPTANSDLEVGGELFDCEAASIYTAGNDNSAMGFPCLSFCSFQLDGGTLHMVAHYRSQYLIKRGYGNYLGLSRLLCYVCRTVDLDVGQLMVVAGAVAVDAPKYQIVHLQQRASLSVDISDLDAVTRR
jgi:hypothetical protein